MRQIHHMADSKVRDIDESTKMAATATLNLKRYDSTVSESFLSTSCAALYIEHYRISARVILLTNLQPRANGRPRRGLSEFEIANLPLLRSILCSYNLPTLVGTKGPMVSGSCTAKRCNRSYRANNQGTGIACYFQPMVSAQFFSPWVPTNSRRRSCKSCSHSCKAVSFPSHLHVFIRSFHGS
jgi:hypothetical protein